MSDAPTTIMERIPAGACFVRVPATIGGGDLLLTSVTGGCAAIAPPWTALRAAEPVAVRATWRLGWFAADADGVDLDVDPAMVEGPVDFAIVWSLAASAEDRGFLRASYEAYLRHLGSVRQWLGDRETREVDGELTAQRAVWDVLFAGEPWPADRETTVGRPRPRPLERFRDFRSRAGRSIVWVFGSAPFTAIQGPRARAADEPLPGHHTFGRQIMLVVNPQTGAGTLRIEFDGLRQTEADTMARLGNAALVVHIVEQRSDLVVARARFPVTVGRQETAVGLSPQLATARLLVAFEADPS